MTAYARAMTLTKTASGLEGTLDVEWQQGRGVFGGILAALLLEAMRREVDADRPLRSLTMHFGAPATAGPFVLAPTIERVGNRITHASARLLRDGSTTTFATASFCKARPTRTKYMHASMPAVPPARDLARFPSDVPGIPSFFRHVDARFCGPIYPFTGSAEASIAAWVRLDEPVVVDACMAVLLLDLMPPAIAATFDAPRPVASVDFTAQLFEHLPLESATLDDHFLVSITSRWADDGYSEELRELWTPDGRLVGNCRQLIAVLG